jgi:hypothetical protein
MGVLLCCLEISQLTLILYLRVGVHVCENVFLGLLSFPNMFENVFPKIAVKGHSQTYFLNNALTHNTVKDHNKTCLFRNMCFTNTFQNELLKADSQTCQTCFLCLRSRRSPRHGLGQGASAGRTPNKPYHPARVQASSPKRGMPRPLDHPIVFSFLELRL